MLRKLRLRQKKNDFLIKKTCSAENFENCQENLLDGLRYLSKFQAFNLQLLPKGNSATEQLSTATREISRKSGSL